VLQPNKAAVAGGGTFVAIYFNMEIYNHPPSTSVKIRARAGRAGAPSSLSRRTTRASNEAQRLIATLVRELFQTENSALRHPAREAERLGYLPPSRAMAAISRHAAGVLDELPRLAQARGLPASFGGLATGRAFSVARDKVLDLFLTTEKSYRGTLVGLRHGVDLVKLLRETADAAEDFDLATFCDRWLAERVPLVADAASELAWFGARPDVALSPACRGFFARLARASMRVVGAVEYSLSEVAGPSAG
jgi:hypothetical protein